LTLIFHSSIPLQGALVNNAGGLDRYPIFMRADGQQELAIPSRKRWWQRVEPTEITITLPALQDHPASTAQLKQATLLFSPAMADE
jgi:hypothetical protein